MNTIKLQLNQMNQSRRDYGPQLRKFCVYTSLLMFLVCLSTLMLGAEEIETEKQPSTADSAEIQTTEDTAQEPDLTGNTEPTAESTKEIITGTSKKMESYEQQGITILIDEAKTVRRNEQGVEIGFLNADKITLKRDLETGETKEIVAEGNVEIRDQDIFATCDHAIMDNLTSTIILKENVVVLQNKDRLETIFFTFNRITGRQTAEGDVKFKVTVTQAAPVDAETEVNPESDTDTEEENTSETAPQEAETPPLQDTDTETDNTDGDAEDKSEADVENSEDVDTEEDVEGDTSNADDAAPDAETKESEDD